MDENDLTRRLRARQVLLRAILDEAHVEGHAGEAGDIAEGQGWRPVLRKFLPWRYQVGTGFVVDHTGDKSEQQDIILYDRQYSPALLSGDDVEQSIYVPVEAVYAVLEAKPVLNRQYVVAAMKKAASVRRLERTQAETIQTAHGEQDAAPHGDILAGIVTRGSDWAWNNIHNTLPDAFNAGADEHGPGAFLSIGLALDHGNFRLEAEGELHTAAQDTALISFLMELLRQLAPLGTAGRMDIGAYHSALAEWGGS